jgi:hypothetical protein
MAAYGDLQRFYDTYEKFIGDMLARIMGAMQVWVLTIAAKSMFWRSKAFKALNAPTAHGLNQAGPSIELIATTSLQTSQGHPNFKKEQVETLFAQLQQKLGGAKQRRAAIAAEYEMLGLEN